MQQHDSTAPGNAPHQDKSAASSRVPARGAAQPPSILNAAPKLAVLLRCLRRRLALALVLGVILAGLAGSATWFFAPPPRSEVRALLRVPSTAPYVVRTAEAIPEAMSHQRNQVAMGKSRLVLRSALRDPEVGDLKVLAPYVDVLGWLEKNVQLDFSVAPEIMRIKMSGTPADEKDLETLVNAICRAYQREVVDRDREARQDRKDRLGKMIEKYDNQLKENRAIQRAFEEEVGKDPEFRGRLLNFAQMQLEMNERELLTTQSQLRQAQAALQTLKAREEKFDQIRLPEAEIKEAVGKNPEIVAVDVEVQRLQTRISKTLERSALEEQDPAVLRDRKSLARAKGKRTEISDRVRPALVEKLREKARLDNLARIAIESARVETLKQTEELLAPLVKAGQANVRKLAKQGAKLDAFREDFGSLEEMTKRLKNEREALNVELAAPSRMTVLEEATVLRPDAEMRKILMTAGAAGGALFLVFFAVAFLESRARRVDQVDEVVFGLGMRLVGTVPKVGRTARAAPGKPNRDAGQQLLTESVDAARTMLVHLARTWSLRTVMVTSAMAGEGKTSLSCRLAASLARAGLKTLLIDADTRNPSVHKVFGSPCEPGFCEVLAGQADVRSCLRPTPVANLVLLSAGRWSEQFAGVLGQGGAGALFKQFHEEFDLILVDSPPVLPVADALQIGQQVDGVLLSVLGQVSRLTTLYAAAHRLEELNIRTLGVVVNGTQEGLYGAGYRYPKTPPANAPEAKATAKV